MEQTSPTLPPLSDSEASGQARTYLKRVNSALGMVPNLHRTIAHSPSALRAYVDMATTLAGGMLDGKLREQIAVAVAGFNRCDYCASAHTVLGRAADISDEELAANLRGDSRNLRVAELLKFVYTILEHRGDVPDTAVKQVLDAGFSFGEVVEVIAHTAMNIFTNYFNRIARTEIDFPIVRTGAVQ